MIKNQPNVSYQEVAAAIETLILEGKSPSTNNIRRVLAKDYPDKELRGSPNHVLPLARQYKKSSSYDVIFRDSNLSKELIGAMVAETKRHMASAKEQQHLYLVATEEDRDQFLYELTSMTEERDMHLEKIATMEKAHAREIKVHEVELAKLQERIKRWEESYNKIESDLSKSESLLEGKIKELAVAEEKAKPAIDLKTRLDSAEQKKR